jgi:hypothetical protein
MGQSPSKVTKSLVRIGHTMDIIAFLDGCALAVIGIHNLGG